ncbi:element excision factor XisH family protein [Anaerolineales bacterium HSG25]|nr:element excision factor XisH family protein [Anaerolineales bacterium HSG25]
MAKDIIHDQVKNALIKDGWTITHEPFTIIYEGEPVYADLGAKRSFIAERDGAKVLVEIKSFLNPSAIHDFKEALGQYLIYRELITEVAPNYKPILAISEVTYYGAFQRAIIKLMLERYHIALLVVNIPKEEVVLWIN